jgi:hypothetical protein
MTQNWRVNDPLLRRKLDVAPLAKPFLLNSFHLVLPERLCTPLFELKQAPPPLALGLMAPV